MLDQNSSFMTREKSTTIFVAGFILLGIAFTLVNIETPIVRNSVIYARIIQAIDSYGILGSIEYARNKPLGFPIVSYPFASLFGVNTGLKLSSLFWTSLWVVTVPVFLKRLGCDSRLMAVATFITVFNPLVFYQFMSGYQDTLFALLFLWAMIFLDRATSRTALLYDGPIFALLVVLAVWVKHHGLILLPLGGLFIFMRRGGLSESRINLLVSLFFLLVLSGVIIAAQNGLVPTFNMGTNKHNFLQGRDRIAILASNTGYLLVFLTLAYSVLAPTLFIRRSYPYRLEWSLVLLIFVGPIIYYEGTGPNIRYYIAVAPLLALPIAVYLSGLGSRKRSAALVLFTLINAFTILNYNNVAFSETVSRFVKLPTFDNLRLTAEQERERKNLNAIRNYLPDHDNTLIFLSQYYGNGTFHVWERAGLLPSTAKIIYARKWKRSLIRKHHPHKAVIYEYAIRGKEGAAVGEDRRIKKIHDTLFLLQPD